MLKVDVKNESTFSLSIKIIINGVSKAIEIKSKKELIREKKKNDESLFLFFKGIN